MQTVNIFWFRRDLRLTDNAGLYQALKTNGPVLPIFNPYLQTKKFDPKLEYINRWVPELNELNYPKPIVEHEFARKQCLELYARGLKK